MTSTAHDPYAALTPADQSALCAHFSIPTPTPDVPFSTCVERMPWSVYSGHALGVETRTPAQIMYAALSSTTDVRLMIAAHALRCGVTKLPPDAQLDPKPLPKLAHAPPKPPKTEPPPQRGAPDPKPDDLHRLVPADAVLVALAPCASRAGSGRAERYATYRVGLTVQELLAAGVRRKDLYRDLGCGRLTFGPKQV